MTNLNVSAGRERGRSMGGIQPNRRPRSHRLRTVIGILLAALSIFAAGSAEATPEIVIDVASGNVLFEQEANQPWYPASLTKLMTIYVALSAVRDHQISLDTPLVVSARAASMAPSKMGFAPGTEVTLDNALKMLVVKSANDIAITVAEGIAGSVEAFAEDMNRSAAELGMTESHFVNPNGLHDPDHFSSARDLAILARALYLKFPNSAGLFSIGALRLGDEIIPTHNNLLGRYPGADGMKTGFTCSAGFNLVASAERGGHHYVAIVLGAPSVQSRLVRTAVLLDRAFAGIDHPEPMSDATAEQATAPDMHDEVCRRRGKALQAFEAETERLEAPLALPSGPVLPANGFLFNAAPPPDQAPMAARIAMEPAPVFDPVPVYIGPAPGYAGPIAEARPPHSPIGTPFPPEAAAASAPETPDDKAAGMPSTPEVAAVPKKSRLAEKHATRSTASKSEKDRTLAAEPDEDAEGDAPPPAAKKKHALKTATAAKAVAERKAAAELDKTLDIDATDAPTTHKRVKHKAKLARSHKTTIAKGRTGHKVAALKPRKLAAKGARLAAKPKSKHASTAD